MFIPVHIVERVECVQPWRIRLCCQYAWDLKRGPENPQLPSRRAIEHVDLHHNQHCLIFTASGLICPIGILHPLDSSAAAELMFQYFDCKYPLSVQIPNLDDY